VEPRRQDVAGVAGDRQRTDELVLILAGLGAWGLSLEPRA
jgi:hypothetical protein